MEMIRGLAGGTVGGDRNQISSEPCGRRLPPGLEASGARGSLGGPRAALRVWRHHARLFNQAHRPEDKEARGGNPREERGHRARERHGVQGQEPAAIGSSYLLSRGGEVLCCPACPLSLPEVLGPTPGIRQTVPPQFNPISPHPHPLGDFSVSLKLNLISRAEESKD